jgi:hypothetical protein
VWLIVIENKGNKMAMFIEVNSVEKNCPVIINLDHVVEVAPLISGGCELSMLHSSGMNSKTSFRVTNEYNEFMQFVMQTVSADDIAKRFPKAETSAPKKSNKLEIPKFGE